MRIVVLGSDGQLGSQLLKSLPEVHRQLSVGHESIEVLGITERSPRGAISSLAPVDLLIDTQAAHPRATPVPTADDYIQANVVRLGQVLEACQKASCSRFVFISTNSVSQDLNQKIAAGNLGLYTASKIMGEEMVRAATQHIPKTLILRLPQILGPGANSRSFLADLAGKIAAKTELKLFGLDSQLPFITPRTVAICISRWIASGNTGTTLMEPSDQPTLTLAQIVEEWERCAVEQKSHVYENLEMDSRSSLRQHWISRI